VCLETMVDLTLAAESALVSPRRVYYCHHGVKQENCDEAVGDVPCPSEEDIKYKMTRLTMKPVNLALVEHDTALVTKVNQHSMTLANGFYCFF